MNKFTTSISNNVLRVIKQCEVYPSHQCIPVKYITSIEHFRPLCITIQYNTNNQYNRIEMEYSTHEKATSVFNELQTELEKYHTK
jgi:hypothetical protein